MGGATACAAAIDLASRYSSRTRGSELERPEIDQRDAEVASPARQAAKAASAKLIRKVYEVDSLLCPKCSAQMRVIALIKDPAVIQRILTWLGVSEPPQPGGPPPPAALVDTPLTYHPVPDIALARPIGARCLRFS